METHTNETRRNRTRALAAAEEYAREYQRGNRTRARQIAADIDSWVGYWDRQGRWTIPRAVRRVMAGRT